jgi:hypothetical protein
MLRQLLVSIVAAVIGFGASFSFQHWTVNRDLDALFKREERVDTVEEWTKRARQHIAGVFLSQFITNALLGAILAVLVFR